MIHEPHTGFIVAAYAIATVVVVTMIVVIVNDYRTLRRDLARFSGRESDPR